MSFTVIVYTVMPDVYLMMRQTCHGVESCYKSIKLFSLDLQYLHLPAFRSQYLGYIFSVSSDFSKEIIHKHIADQIQHNSNTIEVLLHIHYSMPLMSGIIMVFGECWAQHSPNTIMIPLINGIE